MNEELFRSEIYYALALDPIHIGIGGQRLSRVDLSIMRDPATGIPKIPGTSLSGVARFYTAMKTPGKFLCAGKGGEGGEKHCGEGNPAACPVCVSYGFSKGSGFSIQGMAQFFDAHIVFFPIATMAGPVWVTSPMALGGITSEETFTAPDEAFYPLSDSLAVERLNFGWLMLNKATGAGRIENIINHEKIPKAIKDSSVLVKDNLFSHIVNTNLEVRTSVSIDPATGAAEEGALFTYEAVPRGTFFKFEIVCDNPKFFKINNKPIKDGGNEVDISWIKTQVEKGLSLFEHLGIGGMNTRGMGRLKVMNLT